MYIVLGGVDWLGCVLEEQGRQPAAGLVQHGGCTEWLCQLDPVTARELPQSKLQVSLVQHFKNLILSDNIEKLDAMYTTPLNEGGCTEIPLKLLTQLVGLRGGGGLHSLRGLLRLRAWCWLASGLMGSTWCISPLQTEAVPTCKTNFDWTSYKQAEKVVGSMYMFTDGKEEVCWSVSMLIWNLICLEEEGWFKERILLCTETFQWSLSLGLFRAGHVLMPRPDNIAWCMDIRHRLGLRHSELTRNLFYGLCWRCWWFYTLCFR